MEKRNRKVSRRSFLGRGAASLVGAGIGLAGSSGALAGRPGPQAENKEKTDEKPAIKEYRTLGRTGYKVSDIAFGGATMTDPALLDYAMDRGINYVDTARQYYDMEIVIGKLFPAKRDKLFITTKLEPELVTADVTVDKLLAGIDESLQRLNTGYVDCCLIH